MKFIIFIALSLSCTFAEAQETQGTQVPQQAQQTSPEPWVCGLPFESVAATEANSPLNNGQFTAGVQFPFLVKLADGFQHYDKSGLNMKEDRMENQVTALNKKDVPAYVSSGGGKTKETMQMYARYRDPEHNIDQEPDAPRAEMAFPTIDESFVNCSPERNWVRHYFTVAEAGKVYCLRVEIEKIKKGKSKILGYNYGAVLVNAVCNDGVVFNWIYSPVKDKYLFKRTDVTQNPSPVKKP